MAMPTKNPVYLLAPKRTPIGNFGGALASLTAADLGVAAVRGVLEEARLDPRGVEELTFGNARQAGVGPNVARQILHRSGLPENASAHTVNKACGSGLQAIVDAARIIQLEEASCIVAGGTESMSNTPYLIREARWGHRMGHMQLIDAMFRDGFLCPLCGFTMGETVEKLAREYGISRQEQDCYALDSQRRNQRTREAGLFNGEIVPVWVNSGSQNREVKHDEHPRDDLTLEKLEKLQPVFAQDGTIHAGNASGITDGAAALLVVDERRRRELDVRGPQCRIVGYTTAGVDPAVMGLGPVPAVTRLLQQTGVALDQIDLIELNEAFAAQVLACVRDLRLDLEAINVNGGAIAMGHPIGCTGARIVVTLMYEMHRRRSRYGVATLCISGGMGMALLLENVSRDLPPSQP